MDKIIKLFLFQISVLSNNELWISATDLYRIHTIAGKQISIPCHNSDWDENEVLLVLWYREESAVPFYRVDSRNRPLFNARHTFNVNELGNRFSFDVNTNPPVLKINPVLVEDEGEYRCRVDYKKKRTQTFVAFLEVIGPPKDVIIMDTNGVPLKGMIGPFDEYTYIGLICEARNGNPNPALIWYQISVLEIIIDNSYGLNSTGIVRNALTLRKLGRNDYMSKLTCRASSNALYEPIDTSVIIDMNLKPLSAKIVTESTPLLSGNKVEFRCISNGSRPVAQMEWSIGSEQLDDVQTIVSRDENSTLSIVTFVPQFTHNGQHLNCRSYNPKLANSSIVDSILLTVEFEPQIQISLDSSTHDIREGDNVRIRCQVLAYPWIDSIEWAANGKLIKTPALIDKNQTLVMNSINRSQSGRYQCTGSNSIGRTASEVLEVIVKYSPVCKRGQKIYYNVVRNLINRIQCSVEANPVDSSLKFKWFVNTSIEMFELKSFDVLSDELTTSIANYRPKTIMSYAMVLCYAENSAGMQREPCIYYLRILNGPPESVRNCEIKNKSFTIISVDCRAGNNGGVQQTFHLEVYKTISEDLHSNYTTFQPNFIVDNLMPETFYNFIVYSSNAKGNSIALTYHSVRLPVFETQNRLQKEMNPLLNSLIGIVASVVIFSVFVVAVVRIRSFIYEDEYKLSDRYYQNNRCSQDSDEICDETDQRNLMFASNGSMGANESENQNSRLTSLKRLTNRLKATKCKTYEVTGIGKYTKVLDTEIPKRVVTFADMDVFCDDFNEDVFEERAIDVEGVEHRDNGETEEEVVVREEKQRSGNKSVETIDSNMRSDRQRLKEFFVKSFSRKTL